MIGNVLEHTVDPMMNHPLTTALTAPLMAAGGPMGAVARGAAMVAPAMRGAQYVGQKSAELSLPPDTRAMAEHDPSRISGNTAAWDAAAVAGGLGGQRISDYLDRPTYQPYPVPGRWRGEEWGPMQGPHPLPRPIPRNMQAQMIDMRPIHDLMARDQVADLQQRGLPQLYDEPTGTTAYVRRTVDMPTRTRIKLRAVRPMGGGDQ